MLGMNLYRVDTDIYECGTNELYLAFDSALYAEGFLAGYGNALERLSIKLKDASA